MNTSTLPVLPQRSLRGGTDLGQLITILQDQQAAKLDLVLPTSQIRFNQGLLAIADQPVDLNNDGVTDPNGLYVGTEAVDQQIADLFGIPVRYLRRMRAEHVELLDTNVNEWAARAEGKRLVRLLQGSDPEDPTTSGIVRAVLSDRYAIRDNIDTVFSVLQGLREAGLDGSNISGIDLSDNRLYLAVNVPQIAVDAKELVRGYRSPFDSRPGEELPLLNAGLVFTNSEVGRGAFEIFPRAVLQVCKNGLTRKVDGFRKIHLGGRLEEGTINWSTATVDAANEFVRQQVKDAVASFLSEGYLENLRDDLLKDAGVEVVDVVGTVEFVSKKLQYTQTEQDAILADFIKGGQVTSGGVLNSVTSVAQKVEDPERAYDLEASAIEAMQVAARFAAV